MPESFTVVKTPHGIFTSEDHEGNKLVSSATEHQCRELTHFYLKGLQEKKTSYATPKKTTEKTNE